MARHATTHSKQQHFLTKTPRMFSLRSSSAVVLTGIMLLCPGFTTTAQTTSSNAENPAMESEYLTKVRQLTFEGKRAGEGYFNADGSQLVFQSEREAGNPFFQIYVMDLENGDIERVSPGHGKTTCAWIHPSNTKVLFASTQDDPDARAKQKKEIELRNSGEERRYAWDYDEHFEIYEFDRTSKKYKNLTNSRGYDAEGSWSPDGSLIAFTSNRRGYRPGLSDPEKKNFAIDPAYLNDIYIMNADGSDLKQLTTAPGYDGGPFFSPDGKRICWRRFAPNGATAEVWTMNIDGTDQQKLTSINAMSWAPYYHPSGDYLIFTTNKQGFANFELYMIDAKGTSKPVRVTYTDGFDGLPVFTPDGNRLAWTTNRTAAKKSQIFMANWNDQKARQQLGITSAAISKADAKVSAEAKHIADKVRSTSSAVFSPQDVLAHVDYLCRKELGGRLTGTRGERLATAYVAAYLDNLGLKPAGDKGTWFQEFDFTSGVALGEHNMLSSGKKTFELNMDWRPLAFSGNGHFSDAPLVVAGYGIVASKTATHEEYDSYVHLDVKNKWVVIFRYMPENISPEQRQQLSRQSDLRFKATEARDRGAKGLIIVTGPTAQAKTDLIPLRLDGILAGSSLPVVSVSDKLASQWFAQSGKNLEEFQTKLDSGGLVMGFELKGASLSANIEIKRIKGKGRNVLGRLQFGEKPSDQVVIVGAHVDHLGTGANSSSLARANEMDATHYGADDNASGVAAMLEVAEYLADQKQRGKLSPRRDIIFAAWSGEELGLLGSDHFVKNYGGGHSHSHHAIAPPVPAQPTPKKKSASTKLSAVDASHSHGGHHSHSLHPAIAACINMDMVGRLKKQLILQGIGSSSVWRSEIERRNAPVGLAITLQEDSFLPTDARSFYMSGVPVLSAFTGSHSEYHTPRDKPDTLNYEGAASVAKLMGLITRSIAMREKAPDYIEQQAPQNEPRGRLRAYLGTVPDYAEEVKGVLLGGATKGGPADKAGVQKGDIIIELAGKSIENIYDYTRAIEGLKVGAKVKLVVQRNGKKVTLELTPGSRE